MAANVRFKGQTIGTKSLKGGTLAEIDHDRQKNGLVDPNDKSQRFYGVTDVTIHLIPDKPLSIGPVLSMSRSFAGTMKYTECSAEVSATTTICKPKDFSKLSKEAQKEWKRFEAAVDQHEKLHIEDGKTLAQTMVDEVLKLNAEGESETFEDVARVAVYELEKLFIKKFGGGDIQERINAEMKYRDSKDKHGEKSGVLLRTSIR